MSSQSIKFINAFENTKISELMNYYQTFFNYIFPLYYTILKHHSYSFYKELLFLILEYLCLLMFIFQPPVSNINII